MKNPPTTFRGREKYTKQQMEASSGRRLLHPLGKGTRTGTAVLTEKVSRHNLFAIQCRPIASNKWYPWKETQLYIRDIPRFGPLRRQFSKMSRHTVKRLGNLLREEENPFKVGLRIHGIPQDAET